MRRRLATFAAVSMLALALGASPALASGPATSHRGTVTADCGGTTYTVVVENGGQNVGAVQVLDQFGHAIIVYGSNSYWDIQAGFSLGYFPSGHGAGHGGQTTVECYASHTYQVSDLMSDTEAAGLGISPSDYVLWQLDYVVVLKV